MQFEISFHFIFLFDSKYSKNSNIMKYFFNLKTVFYCNLLKMYSYDVFISVFSSSLLQSSVSHDPRNHSNMMI